MQIRTYEYSDERGVIDLWNEVLPDSAPHNEPAISLRNKLAIDGSLILVAVESRNIVGTVMGGYDGHRGWVYSLAVLPSRRRRGVGTVLVRELETRLQRRGCLKVNLQIRASITGVVAFYERLGYDVEERLSLGKRLYE